MPEEFANVFFRQPAFALVIGISKYKNGVDMDKGDPVLEPNQFPNLKLADKDARDFATFLETNGFIGENVRLLLDKEAGIDEIRKEFDALRKRCKFSGDENPLVIVYFSGHGWADEDDKSHYLIPWDAERDELFTTALSNRAFNELLDRLKTNRLAVFLDACHAGAMGIAGPKGPQPQYDYRALGEGEGRYLIASCRPEQKSYEPKPGKEPSHLRDNSIFTGHLLQLLKCETDDLDKEEIDILDLLRVLRGKVLQTVHDHYGNDTDQEPYQVTKGTGLILAINHRAKRKKLELDKAAHEKKIRFLAAICERIARPEFVYDLKTIVTEKLKSYVATGKQFDGHNEFYRLFEGYSNKKTPDDFSRLDECVELLIDSHRRAFDAAPVSEESPSQEAKAVDKFEQAPETKVLGGETSQTASTPTSPSDQQQAKWQMSEKDRDRILEKITPQAVYFKETRTLRSMLNQPVSEADFINKVLELGENWKGGDDLQGVLDEIVERFRECWAKPKTNAPEKLSDFLMQKRSP